jgi:hypothetical protein
MVQKDPRIGYLTSHFQKNFATHTNKRLRIHILFRRLLMLTLLITSSGWSPQVAGVAPDVGGRQLVLLFPVVDKATVTTILCYVICYFFIVASKG